jgi:arabinofuranan 3-O-arabinosyltransferase
VRTRLDRLLVAALAAVAFGSVFTSRPGQVAADTKQYLYLDPARLTQGAASMWDPSTGLGTVTHQNIGYLLPMGPYYTLVSWLGIPMWVGQRIWMGFLLLAAGTGVAWCARQLGLEGPGRALAAFAYMLSPYILDYLDRISAILMPWAALGWMVGLTAVAARRGGWRAPAGFALVVAVVGGVNATSILLVIAAPALWLVHAVWVSREVTLRRALAVSGRLAVLCIAVSVWWAAGLWAEGRYGINVLRVTETVPTVSKTSSAAEVLRGLGYWYFYGWDKVQPWTLQSVSYTQAPWLLVVSYLVPALSILAGLVTRWVYRSYCLMLVGAATVVAVGAYPYTHPSWFGDVIKGASAGSELALAMRSVDRIVPVVLLGLALLGGSGVTALYRRRPAWGMVGAGTGLALVAANLPAAWTGGLVAANLSRPSALPAYWTAAARYLNAGGDSRVLGLPGEDFAAYSFGVTEDPVAPGLLDRGFVTRQVVPVGTPAAANLVQAVDEPIQEGTLDFAALAPIARLMGVGSILLQSDLQYERYNLPLPQVLWQEMTSASAALGPPVTFGGPDPAPTIRYPLDSELRLGLAPGTPQPPALAVFNVADPRPLVRAESTSTPMIVAGDGSGLVEAATAGLLGGDQAIFYAADHPAIPAGSTLVLTDTNPLAYYQWGGLQANVGKVEQPGVPDPSVTPSDYDLPVFLGDTPADQTVAVVSGVKSVEATQYGDSLTFNPERQPLMAFDGNPTTAWTFGAHEAVSGITLTADLDGPVTAGHVTLRQIRNRIPVPREITEVTLRFDGRDPVTVRLTPASWSPAGQTVNFPARTFSDFELTVDSATGGADKKYDGLPQVGFSAIDIPGVGPAHESLQMPTDLLGEAGAASWSDPLDILMSRARVSQPPRQDPEQTISRTFDLPSARSFDVAGTAEVNAGDSDYLIDQMVGLTAPGPLPPVAPASTPGPAVVLAANSSTRLDEDRWARADAALDGNPDTAWIAETGPQGGEWIEYYLSKPVTFDHLDLQVLNDGIHSVPTRITISTEDGSDTVNLPAVPVGSGRPAGATTSMPITFPALTGSRIRITIDAVHEVRALDYYSTYTGYTDILPVGIAELGLAGVVQPPLPARVPAVCTGSLLAIDGHPVDVEVTGTTADALAGGELTLRPCGNSVGGIRLGPGTHTVTTAGRLVSGWSIDQLWLSSGRGGVAVPLAATVPPAGPPAAGDPSPAAVEVTASNRTSLSLKLTGTGRPFWLVLGESYSTGWRAELGGRSLGRPVLTDGYANGWYVPALAAGRTVVVHLSWVPQEVIWAALAFSAAAIAGSLGLLAVPAATGAWRRRRRSGASARSGSGSRRPPGGEATGGERGARRVGPGPGGWRPPGPRPASLRCFAARRSTPPAGWWGLVGAAAATGLAAAAVSRPAIGLVAAAAVVLAGRWTWGRAACRSGAVGVLLALPVYVTAQQVSHRYWPSIDWPADISLANDLAWLALALLGADLVAAAVYRRSTVAGSD